MVIFSKINPQMMTLSGFLPSPGLKMFSAGSERSRTAAILFIQPLLCCNSIVEDSHPNEAGY
jgi:hypothetical protein